MTLIQSPLVGRRPMLHQLPRRWCLVAYKKNVAHYLKQTTDDEPLRRFKGPGINGMSGFRNREDAERWATRPANRLYRVEGANKHIARAWFDRLKFYLLPGGRRGLNA